MNIRRIPANQLKPGDAAYEKIKRSINDFSHVDPVIWNEGTGNFLLRLGFIGDEFREERKTLLSRLTGSAAFKEENF